MLVTVGVPTPAIANPRTVTPCTPTSAWGGATRIPCWHAIIPCSLRATGAPFRSQWRANVKYARPSVTRAPNAGSPPVAGSRPGICRRGSPSRWRSGCVSDAPDEVQPVFSGRALGWPQAAAGPRQERRERGQVQFTQRRSLLERRRPPVSGPRLFAMGRVRAPKTPRAGARSWDVAASQRVNLERRQCVQTFRSTSARRVSPQRSPAGGATRLGGRCLEKATFCRPTSSGRGAMRSFSFPHPRSRPAAPRRLHLVAGTHHEGSRPSRDDRRGEGLGPAAGGRAAALTEGCGR